MNNYSTLFYAFYVFFENPKNMTFYVFFELLQTFSQTLAFSLSVFSFYVLSYIMVNTDVYTHLRVAPFDLKDKFVYSNLTLVARSLVRNISDMTFWSLPACWPSSCRTYIRRMTLEIFSKSNCTCRQLGRTADETNTRYQYVHLIMKSLVLLGRVALGAQRPIVVKLPRERSVGRSVRLSVGLSSEL